MDFFRTFRLQLILLCFTSFSFGQIESGKVKAPEKAVENQKEKPAKKDRVMNYEPSNVFYLGGSLGYGFRTLAENAGYFGEPLGTRANEIPTNTGGFSIGMRNRLVRHLYLDFGVSLAKNGEEYAFGSTDSSYHYKTTYTYFAVPVKLQYITGKKVKFIAGIGLQPQMFIAYKQVIDWRTTENERGTETLKTSEGLNFFTIAALANVGIEWQFAKNTSLYLLPEVRSQLNSSFGKQEPYIHKGVFYGIQFGLSFGLN